ncbi:MAG: sigma-70 family RNA polymerase sigma factor [Alphaproteobacteria bacterium]|nr:sigma-70 family RNA polymerase sigma factor [Alphaproteobacteria bacterium]
MCQVAEQIESHVPALKRYARVLTRDTTEAEDLVQECVVRALTKADLYKPDTNLRAWLFTILYNLHISEVRRKGKWKQAGDPEAALNSLSVPPAQTHSVMLQTVRDALTRLPKQQKAILYLVGVEGQSYKEVADRLDIPLGTVKSRCSRARETLQRELTQGEAELPLAA